MLSFSFSIFQVSQESQIKNFQQLFNAITLSTLKVLQHWGISVDSKHVNFIICQTHD